MYCKDPEPLLFNDFDAVATEKWVKVLKSQPAAGWDDTVTYSGVRKTGSLILPYPPFYYVSSHVLLAPPINFLKGSLYF